MFLLIAGLVGLFSIIAATREYCAAIRFIQKGLKEDLLTRVWYALNARKRIVNGSLLLAIHLASGIVIWVHGGVLMKIPHLNVPFGMAFIAAAIVTATMQFMQTRRNAQAQ